MNLVNIAELKSHLSDVIAKVGETGEEVIIGKYGKPVAKIVPYVEEKPKKRKIGFARHLTNASVDELQKAIDEPLDEEIMELFYK